MNPYLLEQFAQSIIENCSASEDCNVTIWRQGVLSLAKHYLLLSVYVQDCARNWDCDPDSHKYKTPCRSCAASRLLEGEESTSTKMALPPEDCIFCSGLPTFAIDDDGTSGEFDCPLCKKYGKKPNAESLEALNESMQAFDKCEEVMKQYDSVEKLLQSIEEEEENE